MNISFTESGDEGHTSSDGETLVVLAARLSQFTQQHNNKQQKYF